MHIFLYTSASRTDEYLYYLLSRFNQVTNKKNLFAQTIAKNKNDKKLEKSTKISFVVRIKVIN
jgi:hypothetical protein